MSKIIRLRPPGMDPPRPVAVKIEEGARIVMRRMTDNGIAWLPGTLQAWGRMCTVRLDSGEHKMIHYTNIRRSGTLPPGYEA